MTAHATGVASQRGLERELGKGDEGHKQYRRSKLERSFEWVVVRFRVDLELNALDPKW